MNYIKSCVNRSWLAFAFYTVAATTAQAEWREWPRAWPAGQNQHVRLPVEAVSAVPVDPRHRFLLVPDRPFPESLAPVPWMVPGYPARQAFPVVEDPLQGFSMSVMVRQEVQHVGHDADAVDEGGLLRAAPSSRVPQTDIQPYTPPGNQAPLMFRSLRR